MTMTSRISAYQFAEPTIHNAVMADRVELAPGKSHEIATGWAAVPSERFALDGIQEIFNEGVEVEGEGSGRFLLHYYPSGVDDKVPHSAFKAVLNQFPQFRRRLESSFAWPDLFSAKFGPIHIPEMAMVLSKERLVVVLAQLIGVKPEELRSKMLSDDCKGFRFLYWFFQRLEFLQQELEMIFSYPTLLKNLFLLEVIEFSDFELFANAMLATKAK